MPSQNTEWVSWLVEYLDPAATDIIAFASPVAHTLLANLATTRSLILARYALLFVRFGVYPFDFTQTLGYGEVRLGAKRPYLIWGLVSLICAMITE
jgi:hypothetical protein